MSFDDHKERHKKCFKKKEVINKSEKLAQQKIKAAQKFHTTPPQFCLGVK